MDQNALPTRSTPTRQKRKRLYTTDQLALANLVRLALNVSLRNALVNTKAANARWCAHRALSSDAATTVETRWPVEIILAEKLVILSLFLALLQGKKFL